MHLDITDQAGDKLVFDWDPQTGEVSGPDGWWVVNMLALWDRFAAFGGDSQQTPNPRHSPAAMMLFLKTQGFSVPPELRAVLPPGCMPTRDMNH